MGLLPFDEVVRLVDDWQDSDPTTRDSSPGRVNGNALKQIGVQIQRRFFGRGSVKHVIFLEENTRNIWYKNGFNNAGVVAMGFSLKHLTMHKKAVPMEVYAKAFLDNLDTLIIELGTTARDWLKRNDFKRY